jgi:hypothetical protein
MARRDLLAMIGAWIMAQFGSRAAAAAEPPVQSKPSPVSAAAVAALPYRRVTVPGDKAYDEWRRLREANAGWPVIIGNDESLVTLAELFDSEGEAGRQPDDILAAARRIESPAASLRKRREDDARQYGDPEMADWLPEMGDWPAPGEAEVIGLTVDKDVLSRKPFEQVHILVLPTSDGAEVPAYLRWGGWNACPSPEMHVAILRDWNHRYGAEVVGLSGDVLNLRVARRPATREEALGLAHEQYYYCEDLIVQGTQTFGALAGALMVSDWWYFWWD